jgi:hypothetical protein
MLYSALTLHGLHVMYSDTFNFLLIEGEWGNTRILLLHKIWTVYDGTLFLCFVGVGLVILSSIVTSHSGQLWVPHSLRIQVSWNVTLHHCVSGSWCYERSCSPIIWAKSVYIEESTLGILHGLISLPWWMQHSPSHTKNHEPTDTLSRPTRPESSARPLREPQILH